MSKVYLNIHELMKLTGASDATLYDHVKNGNLPEPTRRKGKNIVGNRMIMNHWHRDDVQKFMDSGLLKTRKRKRVVDHEAADVPLEQIVQEASRDSGFWYIGCFIMGTLFGLLLTAVERFM